MPSIENEKWKLNSLIVTVQFTGSHEDPSQKSSDKYKYLALRL